jgi:hypothetical protein
MFFKLLRRVTNDHLLLGTTMAPDSEYSFRVLCVNCQGTTSEPSTPLNFTTPHRSVTVNQTLTPKNAGEIRITLIARRVCLP